MLSRVYAGCHTFHCYVECDIFNVCHMLCVAFVIVMLSVAMLCGIYGECRILVILFKRCYTD